MTLTTLFNDFYRPLRLRGRSANTSRLYGCTIRSFWKWLRYEPTLDDLTDLTISRFLEYRASIRSPYTAEKERTQLLSLWRFAADRGLVADRPCVPPAPLPLDATSREVRAFFSSRFSGAPLSPIQSQWESHASTAASPRRGGALDTTRWCRPAPARTCAEAPSQAVASPCRD